MSAITLEHRAKDGELLQATFLPDRGMNLVSYKRGEIEVIEQSTRNLFDERFAGLGALIGPHFHRRKTETLPKIADESLFPHIARIKAKGVQDPFSHGIGRYAPWNAEAAPSSVKARLTGKDLWNGVPLSSLEGQSFNMNLEAHLRETGLHLALSIVSESDSLVGIHYYLALPEGKGRVISEVRDQVRIEGELKPIPSDWGFDKQHHLAFDLNREADLTFRPYPDPLKGHMILETEKYDLRMSYNCVCEENCWQLYHPKDALFVCIEPISAQNPRHPILTASSLNIQLEILPLVKS